MPTSYNISALYRAGITQRTDPFPRPLSGWKLKKYLLISNLCWMVGLGLMVWLVTVLVDTYTRQQAAQVAEIERSRTLEMEINRLAVLHSYNAEQTLSLAQNIQNVVDTAKGARRDFLLQVIPEALRIQALYRIPASATIGMACYESAYGQSDLAQQANNLFGIKAFGDWSGERVNMPTRDLGVLTRANFRVYSDLARGVEGYALFLSNRSRYQEAFQHRRGPDFVQAVAAAGYCPDRNYTMMVSTIIDRHNLTVLDLPDELPEVNLPTLAGLQATAPQQFPFAQERPEIPSVLRLPVLPVSNGSM